MNSYYTTTAFLFNEFNELPLLHLYWNLVKIGTSSRNEWLITKEKEG